MFQTNNTGSMNLGKSDNKRENVPFSSSALKVENN